MTIEIRSFAGSAEELAAFTNSVWQRTYAGQMPTPIWSSQHFERDLLVDAPDRDLLLSAYDGTRLVGSHPARQISVRLHGEVFAATWASFLSVDPEYRCRGVAMKLQAEYVRRHRERQLPVNFGFNYIRSARSMGPEFWRLQGVQTVASMGVWTRPLDHAEVARFEPYRLESWGARALGFVQRASFDPSDLGEIRPYRLADLGDCLRLFNAAGEGADLAYVWSNAEARRQLDFADLSRTLVFEASGRVAGLINYTLLDVLGRSPMRIARVDLMAIDALKKPERRRLLRASLGQMQADGAKGVVALRGSWGSWRDLAAVGFLPMPAEFRFVGLMIEKGIALEGVRRLHVLWR